MKKIANEGKVKRFSSKMQANLLLVFSIIMITFFVLIGRLIYINVKDGKRFEKRVLSQQSYMSSAIPYKRGDIVDRNMTSLAVSVKVYNMILDPVAILTKAEFRKSTTDALVKCFHMTEDEIDNKIEKNKTSRYVIMKDYKKLTYEQVEPFLELQKKDKNVKGIWFEEEYIREYPLKSTACHVIGFTAKGNEGISGIEKEYNEQLNGSNGREYGYFDSQLNLQRTVKAAENGYMLVSTVDANVQQIVQKKIDEFQEKTGGKNVAVLVMNPQNGEIYAMATNSTFDLNNPRDLSGEYTKKEIEGMSDAETTEAWNKLWRNFIISDAIEVGSTYKPFTVAAALDEGCVTLNSTYQCPGYEMVSGRKIGCSHKHGTITLTEAIAASCNTALMKIARKLNVNRFCKYGKIFGFGSKTGIDLPGEANGIVFKEDKMVPTDLAIASFGQGNTETMIQLASAFCSVINGGYYYRPHVVKQILNENGGTIKSFDRELVRKTISKITSDHMKDMLLQTVVNKKGTGKTAKVEGYVVGGKTGTAEKSSRNKRDYIKSFISFTPVEDPKVVVYVAIDEPHVANQVENTVATGLSAEISKEILPFLGVYPSEDQKKESTVNGEAEPSPGT